MPRTFALALALVASSLAVATPSRAETTATVRVDADAFAPLDAAVDVDGTVSWLVQEGGHTIAADDGRFRFRGSDGTTLTAGSTVSFTFDGDEFVPYYCEIHGGPGGQGMAGRVRVGVPPPPPPHRAPVIRVPSDAPTLAAAVARAAPGHRIELAPGDHAVLEPVAVVVDDVIIVGTDRTTRLVPVAGPRGLPSTALHVTASHVRIEHLRIGAFRASGVYLDGADGAELTDVHVAGAGFTVDGIAATRVMGATLRSTSTTGNRGAGVRVADCSACGVLIDTVQSRQNAMGVLLESARGVIVRRSVAEANESGIVARATRPSSPLRPVVATLVDNVIGGNTDTGVRLSGASDTVVTRNRVTGSAHGIVVAGDWSERTTVEANVVDGSLAWDGIGAGVTFADNRDSSQARKDPALDPTASVERKDPQ